MLPLLTGGVLVVVIVVVVVDVSIVVVVVVGTVVVVVVVTGTVVVVGVAAVVVVVGGGAAVVVVVDDVPSPGVVITGGVGSVMTVVGAAGFTRPTTNWSSAAGGVCVVFEATCVIWFVLPLGSVSEGFAATDFDVFGTWTSGFVACRFLRALMRSAFHWSRRDALRAPFPTRIE